MTDILSDLEAKARAATPGPLSVNRYDHGGGRLFIREPLQLIADLYDEGNREYYAAFSPSIALKLLKIARAAQELHDQCRHTGLAVTAPTETKMALGEALAALSDEGIG